MTLPEAVREQWTKRDREKNTDKWHRPHESETGSIELAILSGGHRRRGRANESDAQKDCANEHSGTDPFPSLAEVVRRKIGDGDQEWEAEQERKVSFKRGQPLSHLIEPCGHSCP
jgi:hypothetical protein